MASVAAFGTLARVGCGVGAVGTGFVGAGALTLAATVAAEVEKIVSYTMLVATGLAAFGFSMLYAASLMGRVTIWGTGILALKMPLLIAAISFVVAIYATVKQNQQVNARNAARAAAAALENPAPKET